VRFRTHSPALTDSKPPRSMRGYGPVLLVGVVLLLSRRFGFYGLTLRHTFIIVIMKRDERSDKR